jgi:hypothetical protein
VAISAFASRLFGEVFQQESVIIEAYDEPPHQGESVLPEKVLVTEEMLESLDGSSDEEKEKATSVLVEALLGKRIPQDKATSNGMGDLLGSQKTVQFIEKILFKNPLNLDELVEAYKTEVRPNSSDEECWRELRAAFLAGMNTKIDVHGNIQQRIIPKIHSFFSQGREIKSCITPDAPHLNDAGEVTCPECAKKEKTRIRKTFPLVFCRACGQEYYGVEITSDGTLRPRDIDDIDVEGDAAYIFLGKHDPDKTPPPDQWLTNKTAKIQEKYQEYADPKRADYCSECNKLYRGGGAEPCHCPSKMKVSVVAHPFLFCPSEGCGVFYDKRPREFNKLFSFGTVGRSTATDVIVSNTLNTLPENERKILVFSDNRQDTALQAAHMNNIQKRMHFRRALHKVLGESNGPLELLDIGNEIFKVFSREGVMPKFSRSGVDFSFIVGPSKVEENAFKDYLLFNTVIELGSSQRRNQPNLEDVGLLKVSYRELDKLAKMIDFWKDAQEFLDLSEAQREDYLTGFLNIMRYRMAINNEYLLDSYNFKTKIESRLDEEALFHNELRIGQPQGYSDEANNATRNAQVHRLSWKTGQLVSWTSKVLHVERDRAAEIVKTAANNLAKGWLERIKIKNVGELFMINQGLILLSTPEGTSHKVCKKCGLVHHFQEVNLCTGSKCQDLIERNFDDNYFRFEYQRGFSDVIPLSAAEHSAQIDGETRKDLEVRFRNPKEALNVIVCTPTMELGIDIGKLSAVYMRNVPPSPSNYAQRAGRAGRRSQSSIVNTFCGVGSRRGPHDQYFYRYPRKIISGEISPPRFLLDNKTLVTAHIHSLILETISTKVNQNIGEILDLDKENLPLRPEFKSDLEDAVTRSKAEIIRTVKDALKTEIEQYDWLDDVLINHVIELFVRDFDDIFSFFRDEYLDLDRVRYYINKLAEKELLTYEMNSRRTAIEHKMNEMREGGKDYFTYRYLASQGFTPNYGFPTHITRLSLDHRGKHDVEEISLQRDRAIAVSEYAPGNSIYYRNGRYVVSEARLKLHNGHPVKKSLLICPKCDTYYMDEEIKTSGGACSCGASLQDQLSIKNAIGMPDQFAVRRQGITSDEEERMRLGYNVSEHYHRGPKVISWDVMDGENKILSLFYEHNGKILRVNTGTRKAAADHQQNGFTLCTACNHWIFGEENEKKHIDPKSTNHCWRNAKEEDIIRNLTLYTESLHDVITLDCDLLRRSSLKSTKLSTILLPRPSSRDCK